MSGKNGNLKTLVIGGAVWKFMERISAQLISLLVSIILARMLTPENYGTISLTLVFITLLNVFVSDGFGVALVQKENADDKDFSTVLIFGIIFSLILYVLIYFIVAPLLSNFFNLPMLLPVLRVMLLRLPIASINSVQQAYIAKNMIFKKLFFATIISTCISAIIGIYMAYHDYGVWALVSQYLSNSIISTFCLSLFIHIKISTGFSLNRLHRLFSYGWKLLVQSLFAQVYSNLRTLVVGKVYASEELAFYNQGSYYPNMLITNIDTALGTVLLPAMAMEQKNKIKVKHMVKRTTKIVSYILSPILLGIFACATPIVSLVLSDKWLPIIPYLRLTCINLLFRPAQTAVLQGIKSVGRSDLVVAVDFPVRMIGIILLIIVIRFGIFYIALTELIVTFIGLIFYSYASARVIQYGIAEILVDLSLNISLSFIMCIALSIIGSLMEVTIVLCLTVQIILGIIIYIGLSIFTRNDNYKYLVSELSSIMKSKRLV
jgi:O-antigen/teichoic acid export membrane protein